MSLLELNNIYYKPPSNKILGKRDNHFEIVNISFAVEEKEVTAIVGESSGGKTLLGKLASGIIKPDSGSIELNIEQSGNISPVQILFQNSNELINPYRNVRDILLYPKYTLEQAKYYLDLLKLPDSILQKKAGNLSGGERQRIALARLLLAKPKLLILDEPFSAQDIAAQMNIKNILMTIKNELSLSMIIISHSIRILENLADKILVIKAGKMVEEGNFSEVTQSPSSTYTSFLLKASEYNLSEEEIATNK